MTGLQNRFKEFRRERKVVKEESTAETTETAKENQNGHRTIECISVLSCIDIFFVVSKKTTYL